MNEQRVIPAEQVAEQSRVHAMKPTEQAVHDVNPAGHRRQYRPDGSYTWTNDYKTNDGGKVTNVAHAMTELMQPFVQADTARFGTLQERVERVRMVDAEGRTQFVEPRMAGDCASRNGWRHSWRAGGLMLRSGPDGMLWRLVRDRWEPTGRLEANILGRECPTDAVQRDPDGYSWFHDGEKWRLVDDGQAHQQSA